MVARFTDHLLRGTAAGIPDAADVPTGTLYEESDTGTIRKSNGASWTFYAQTLPPGGSTADSLIKASGSDYDVEWGAGGGGGGGVDLSDFRLPSMADDPGAIALGTFGDEFEYSTRTDLLAVYTRFGGTSDQQLVPDGSDIALSTTASQGLSILRTGLTLPTDFEIGGLFSFLGPNGNPMLGIGVSTDAGNGVIGTVYYNSPGLILWNMAGGVFGGSSITVGGAPSVDVRDGRPFWLLLKKVGSNWTLRFSPDALATFDTPVTGSAAVAATAIGAGRFYSADGLMQAPRIHRLIYGDPNLGV